MHDDGEGDDVWVELLPVQLVDAHRAGFLPGGEKGYKKRYAATSQPAFNQTAKSGAE